MNRCDFPHADFLAFHHLYYLVSLDHLFVNHSYHMSRPTELTSLE